MSEDREYLVRTGLRSIRYRECRWLEVLLGQLYPTRCSSGPVPTFAGASLYRWYRLDRIPESVEDTLDGWLPGDDSIRTACDGELVVLNSIPEPGVSPVRDLLAFRKIEVASAEEASVRPHLTPEAATKIELDRERLLDLKIAVLGELARCMGDRDARGFWARVFRPFADVLIDKDVDFYLQLNGRPEPIASDPLTDAPAVLNGGLINLLLVVGHCYAELVVGRYNNATTSLRERGLAPKSFLDHVDQGTDSAYAEIVDRFLMDEASQSHQFREIGKTIKKALTDDIPQELRFSVRVRREWAEVAGRRIAGLQDWLKQLPSALQAASDLADPEEMSVRLINSSVREVRLVNRTVKVSPREHAVLRALVDAGSHGLNKKELDDHSKVPDARRVLAILMKKNPDFDRVIRRPGRKGQGGYRLLLLSEVPTI